MIRIMILDDDEMYLKKEKEITEQYFAEKNIELYGNDIPECGMVSAGIEGRKIRYVSSGYPDAWRKRNRGSKRDTQTYPDPVIIFITNLWIMQ